MGRREGASNLSDWEHIKAVLDSPRTAKPTERFPRYVISKPAAKRLCAALGIFFPKAGWEVTICERDPSGNRWYLANVAGSSFYLWKYNPR